MVILLEPTLSALSSPREKTGLSQPALDSKPSKDRPTWGARIVASSIGRVFRNDWAICSPSPPAGTFLQPQPDINDIELLPSTMRATAEALSADQWNALASHAVTLYQPKFLILVRRRFTCNPKQLVDAVKGTAWSN